MDDDVMDDDDDEMYENDINAEDEMDGDADGVDGYIGL